MAPLRRASAALPALLALAAALPARPATLPVPGTYPTIAAAMAAAEPGDTVALAPGVYAERVALASRTVLVGAGPPGSVVLEGPGPGSVVVCLAPGPGTALAGVVLRGGTGDLDGAARVGGGLLVRGGELALTDVRLEANAADLGGGLFADGARIVWTGGALSANSADYGAGWFALGGSLRLHQVEVAGNTAVRGGGGYGNGLAPLEIVGGALRDNAVSEDGGALYLVGCGAALNDCRLAGNRADRGAGLFAAAGTVATISYAALVANEALTLGGGLFAECEGPGGIFCAEVRLAHVDLVANRAPRAGAGAASGAARVTAEASLIAANQGGLGCLSPQSAVEVRCSAVAGNEGSPLDDACTPSYADTAGADPRLCDLAGGDLARCSNSPLLSPAPCGLPYLGAHGVGCGPCGTTATVPATWGGLKARYR